MHERIGHDHFAGHLPQNGAARNHQPGILIHQLGDDGAAAEDDRNAEPQTEDEQGDVAFGRRGHGEHVVQRHDQVGNDDDLHCLPAIKFHGSVPPISRSALPTLRLGLNCIPTKTPVILNAMVYQRGCFAGVSWSWTLPGN